MSSVRNSLKSVETVPRLYRSRLLGLLLGLAGQEIPSSVPRNCLLVDSESQLKDKGRNTFEGVLGRKDQERVLRVPSLQYADYVTRVGL
jgi:hypothetical protein